ncbi:MAG: choice-of-anchor I family protein [Clostridia bacterium]|nr:choice-of-anchor I family protein [Clostridia bacterium]
MVLRKKEVPVKKFAACVLLAAVMAGVCGAGAFNASAEDGDVYFNKIAAFDTGNTNTDGGTAEIVHYNSDNGKMYLVNGTDKSIDIISLQANGDGAKTVFDENSDRIKIDDIVLQNQSSFASGFEAGEISSVAVNTDLDVVAVAVQHSDYTQNGAVVLLDYDGNFVAAYQTGVQPDNVVFGGNYILTADEGEPREGYTSGTDPKGSVTVVYGLSADNLTGGTAEQVYFDSFDSQRDSLVSSGVIIMKDANPSVDFEPEYIVTNGTYAYVSLQEANSIAILDLQSRTFTAVCPLGFKDHSQEGNGLDLINDGKINIKTEDVYGVYMPDGMDIYEANGKTYIITANEGDAREWGEFSGVTKKAFTDENGENSTKVEVLDNNVWDGLDEDGTYVLGGRSFSIFEVTDNSLTLVYDSGDSIEQTIASSDYSAYFNCNSDDVSLDARSKKKGPEPEDVTVYSYNGNTYVSVCMERQSGFVTFDISGILSGEGDSAVSKGYTTTRDFSSDMAGDVAPENLEYVAASANALNKDLIIMANENSGTVSVYAIESEQKTYEMVAEYTEAENETTAADVLITEVFATGNNTDGAYNYSFITIANNTAEEIDISGWTIQYKSGTDGWQSFTLETVLNAGGTYTVVCSGASGTYSNRVTLSEDNYDAVWADLAYFDNKDLSVKIVDADGKTVDALGVYDSTNGEEGEGTLLSGTSKQKVISRNTDGNGYVDTNNNSTDFTISNTSKTSTASDYAAYTPSANASAKATAFITLSGEATLSGINYLPSGYVLAGDISFTVTPDTCLAVTEVTAGGTVLTATEGAYTFTLSGDTVITVSTEVSHTLTHTEAKAATCTENGNTEYWYCSVCEKYFSDEDGTTEISVEDTVIAATGHTFGEDGLCTVCGENVLTFELGEDGTYTVTGIQDSSFTKVVIPSTYNGTAVTAIAANAFKNNTAITYLYIPSGITSIGNYAFYGCSALTEIYYNAASVTLAASNYVFYKAGQGANGIAVTIGKDVTSIPDYLFNPYSVYATYAPNLTSVTFEDGSICESIGERAFAMCDKLTSVSFPDSVTTLGTYMFYGCTALEEVAFGSGTTTIGSRVFYSCTALKSVTFAYTIGWYKGQTTTLSNNGYAVNLDVTDSAANAENFLNSWGAYTFIRTDNVVSYYVDGELYGSACYSTSITAKQVTNLKSAISVTSVPSKQCYKGSWDTSITSTVLKNGGIVTVNAVYTLNHTLTHTEAKAVTCTENGNTEYWYCSVCEKYFSDEDGTTEISVEDTVIAATGHNYTETWVWSDDLSTVTLTFTCGGDDYTETVTATVTSKITMQATCTAEGVKTYTATVTFGGQTYTDSKTQTIDTIGHDYEVTGITWAEDFSSATATLTCKNDSSHTETVTSVITSEVTTEATETSDGVRTYTATVTFNGQTYTFTKTESIQATGTQGGSETEIPDDTQTQDSSDVSSADSSKTEDSSPTDSSSENSSSDSSSSGKTGSGCGSIIYSGGDGGSNGDMFVILSAMALMLIATFVAGALKKRNR